MHMADIMNYDGFHFEGAFPTISNSSAQMYESNKKHNYQAPCLQAFACASLLTKDDQVNIILPLFYITYKNQAVCDHRISPSHECCFFSLPFH